MLKKSADIGYWVLMLICLICVGIAILFASTIVYQSPESLRQGVVIPLFSALVAAMLAGLTLNILYQKLRGARA
jgi:hypothetical protein